MLIRQPVSSDIVRHNSSLYPSKHRTKVCPNRVAANRTENCTVSWPEGHMARLPCEHYWAFCYQNEIDFHHCLMNRDPGPSSASPGDAAFGQSQDYIGLPTLGEQA